jgi:type I restriction enzyme S subunit
MSINQAILGINVNENRVEPRFLFHRLRQRQRIFAADSVGVAQKNLSAKYVREMQIPLPPLPEQRRIAGILDAADALRRRRRRAIETLDTLQGALFAEMFGDPAYNVHGFPVVTIGDLLDDVRYGTSKKAGTKGRFPILRMGNVTATGSLDLTALKWIDLDERDIPKHTVRRGDILFNRTNSSDLVGKTALVTTDETYAFAGYLVRARVSNGVAPEYVAGYLNSPHAKAVLRNMAKNIVGMANINAKEMQRIKILLAPRDRQHRFAKAVNSLSERRTTMTAHLAHLDTLFAALQSRAFAGDL